MTADCLEYPLFSTSVFKIKKFLLTLSLALFCLSLLNIFITQNIFLWELTVLTTEFGQYLAVFSIIFIILGPRDYKVLILNCASFLILLSPLIQAEVLEPTYREVFAKAFNREPKPLVSSFQAYFRKDLEKVSYKRYVYRKDDTRDLNLDFYRNIKNPEASPWILIIHGGGWANGDTEQNPDLNWYLARHGFSVIAITYRFAPKFKWPAQKEDVELAFDFIQNHALEFNINPQNFFVLGRSAGAQLAGIFAYNYKGPGLKGYIAFYPPTDLSFGYDAGDEDDVLKSRGLLRDFLGGPPLDKLENYKNASVIEALESHSTQVPTLIFHGTHDSLVWFKHSERLEMHLKAKNVPDAFIKLPWATHGFDFNLSGPGGQISTHLIEDFMNHYSK